MKVLLAHPGTQHSFQLAKQLYKRDLLFEFHTGFAFGRDSWIFKICSLLPKKIYRKISNRFIDDLPHRYIFSHPLIELKSLLRLKVGQPEENVLYTRNLQFQQTISDTAIEAADILIGFDTSSWLLAERCRKLSKKFILDISIAHPVTKDHVYRQIIKLYPEWEFALKQKSHHHIAVEETEMELATQIVVASSFTLGTFVAEGVSPHKISVNPYGVDTSLFIPSHPPQSTGAPLRFVFVGTVDARKGIPFLLEVWKKISSPAAELTLIGPVAKLTKKLILNTNSAVIVKGKLSFKEVREILPSFDVMIFPSFFEGYGLVVAEAMAAGLPVITTTATCAPEIIENGTDGFIIDTGDEKQLLSAINHFLKHREKASEMGELAREKVAQFSWDEYGRRWSELLKRSLININQEENA